MWQNFITSLARNPLALKALAEVVTPTLRNWLKQETGEDVASLRREVGTLTGVATKDLPFAISGLGARQQDLAQSVEALRQEVRSIALRQQERETALQTEVARLGRELEAAQLALRQAQDKGVVPSGKRWLPW